MKSVLALLLFNLFFSSTHGNAQYQLYEVVVGDRLMGELKAYSPVVKDNITYLRVIAEVDIPLFGRTIDVQNEFQDQRLLSAKARKLVDAELKEEVLTAISGKGYAVTFNQIRKKRAATFNESIGFTALMLYYKEPVNVRKVYSERLGEMATVTKIGHGKYELRLPDGKKTIYTYKDGACIHIQSDVMGAKLIFRSVGLAAK